VSNQSVTDKTILDGFKNLHEAMTQGFDQLRQYIDRRFAESEQRMMRHFDHRDSCLDDHERRIARLEQKASDC
jgi:uncharacterized membrane-anchored protein